MSKHVDRILVVDEDPFTLDLLGNQTLSSAGYQVMTVNSGPESLAVLQQFLPDIIIVALEMEGFSGKDLLAALRSQSVTMPVIVMAEKASGHEILDAFRLGARDFLAKPVREAEVISAVDRVMAHVRNQREREQLQLRLQQANRELELRVKELTTLVGVGKAITNLTDTDELFSRLIEAALYVTGGKMGWLLMNDDPANPLSLKAARNMPRSVMSRLNHSWNDGLAPLVTLSGEPLRMTGDGLKRFQAGSIVQSALVVPIIVRKKAVGVLAVGHATPIEFTERHQAMLVAVADYAAIGMVNMRLFQELARRPDPR